MDGVRCGRAELEGMHSLGWRECIHWGGGDAFTGVEGMHSLECSVEGQNWR